MTTYPIHEMSYYSRESAKLAVGRELYKKHKVDLFQIPFVKGIGITEGAVVVTTEEYHPDQYIKIPNELSDEFDGLPVAIAEQGYSYHLAGDINDGLFEELNGYSYARGGGGRGGTLQGGSQILCGQSYGTASGVFDKIGQAGKKYVSCSTHVISECHGGVQIGSGNSNSPQGAGTVASTSGAIVGCPGGGGGHHGGGGGGGRGFQASAGYFNPWYSAVLSAYQGYARGGGGGGGGGQGGHVDNTACPVNSGVSTSYQTKGLGLAKGFRLAKINENVSYLGVRSARKKTWKVSMINYSEKGVCGLGINNMFQCRTCPLPGDSGACYWTDDGYLTGIVTDGSNDKGGENCTGYNCTATDIPKILGITLPGAPDITQTQTAPTVTQGQVQAQRQRIQPSAQYAITFA